jgi:uncharacterized membrane protein
MIDKKIRNITAGFFIALAMIFSINFLMSYWKPGPYSLIALLNENKELGGYPNEVPVNSTVNLYIYIENHENKLELYEIKVYVENSSFIVNSTNYPKGKPYLVFYDLIKNNQNNTIPLNVTFSKPGNYNLIILLYMFNGSDFINTGLYNQLYINSTVK